MRIELELNDVKKEWLEDILELSKSPFTEWAKNPMKTFTSEGANVDRLKKYSEVSDEILKQLRGKL